MPKYSAFLPKKQCTGPKRSGTASQLSARHLGGHAPAFDTSDSQSVDAVALCSVRMRYCIAAGTAEAQLVLNGLLHGGTSRSLVVLSQAIRHEKRQPPWTLDTQVWQPREGRIHARLARHGGGLVCVPRPARKASRMVRHIQAIILCTSCRPSVAC